jgi:hypothetical protein
MANGRTALFPAQSSTLRTALGYRTGKFHDFTGYVQGQIVSQLGFGGYNDGSNGKTRYGTVVDPTGAKLQQAYLQYDGVPGTEIRGGRQEISYRPNPDHRYIGDVLWRQNWQNFDAMRFVNKSVKDTKFEYAYVFNVNRITDQMAPAKSLPAGYAGLSNWQSDSHLFTANFDKWSFAKFEGYSYLLDFANARRFSTATYGTRVSGSWPTVANVDLLYAGEGAYQSDYGNNATRINTSYQLGEAGLQWKVGKILPEYIPVESVTAKFDYERLSGHGGFNAFQTPLGTNHAFQGWADRFLVTPGDGIQDYFFTGEIVAFGAKFATQYHVFDADRLGYTYGDEWDVEVTKKFFTNYTVGLKYADYQGDRNATNVARNPVLAADTSKYWAYVILKY